MWDEFSRIEASLAAAVSAMENLRSSMQISSDLDDREGRGNSVSSNNFTSTDSDEDLDKDTLDLISKAKDFWYYYNEAKNRHNKYEIWVNAFDAFLIHERLRLDWDETVASKSDIASRAIAIRSVPLFSVKEASKMIAAIEECVMIEGNKTVQMGLITLKNSWEALKKSKASQEVQLNNEIDRLYSSSVICDGEALILSCRGKTSQDLDKCLISHMWQPLRNAILVHNSEPAICSLMTLWRSAKKEIIQEFNVVSAACGELLKHQYINVSKLQRLQELFLKPVDHYSELSGGNLIVIFGPTGAG